MSTTGVAVPVFEVPDHIAHLDLTRAIRSLGFSPDNLRSLELRPGGVYAEVFHRTAAGRLVWSGPQEYARHRIWVPVVQDPDEPAPDA